LIDWSVEDVLAAEPVELESQAGSKAKPALL
jgi:hypothetical protein